MKLALIRHGQSLANQQNVFTGWLDEPLTDFGVEEARVVAKKLQKLTIPFDQAFTSVLTRAVKSTNIILEELDQLYVPVTKTWRLNERHYGALQGLDKTVNSEKYGAEQVAAWRRDYWATLPLASEPMKDRRYQGVEPKQLPLGENLAQTWVRLLPWWQDEIAPYIKEDKNILVVSHGNTLRALVKFIEEISNDGIAQIEIPTGTGIVYELSEEIRRRLI